jgi:transposase, IS6 family
MPTNAPPKPERPGETGDAGFFIPVNNPIEADHARLKSRLQAMRGLKQLRCARVISIGHAFIQNIHRGHYERGTEQTVNLRVPAAFDELVMAI